MSPATDDRDSAGGDEMQGLGDRLRRLYELLGGPMKVAEQLGLAKNTPGRWARGDTGMSFHDAARLCAAADVSLEWLAHGGTWRSNASDWVEVGAVYDAAELILEVTSQVGHPIDPPRMATAIRDRSVSLTRERHPQSDGGTLTKTTDP